MSVWQKLNTHGGPNTGCGHFFTPDNRLLAVISDVGIFEAINNQILSVCAPRPNGTVMDYYNYGNDRGFYTVTNGMYFLSSPRSVNVGWLRTDKSLRDHQDVFIAGYLDKIAYARDNHNLYFGNMSSKRMLNVPWYGDYKYVAAFSPNSNLMAIGSKFGSIHIYIMK